MSDLISRADAIEAVEGLTKYMEKLVEGAEKFPEAHTKNYKHDMEQQIVGVAHASQVILELPSADAVEVDRTSEWVAVRREEYEDLIADAEPKWNCTANFIAEQLDRLRKMTDEERWEFFKRFFEMKGGVE